MGRTVDELRRSISGEEFTRQYIYDRRDAQRKELAAQGRR